MSVFDKISAILPFKKPTENSRYFFALNIDLSQVTGIVWGLYGHKLDILGKASLDYEASEDLVEKANQVLDESLGALEIEPAQILFGVPQSWNLDDNLKDPYLKLLNKMVEEFDLSPMAYVTTSHALSHFLQKQEGIPPTAIFLGIGDYIESTLVKGGKIIESKTTKREEDLFDEVEKTFSQFTEAEVLPSKILVYPTKKGMDPGKIKEQLMSFPWVQRLPFLHFPKIEVLPLSALDEALVLAGATEVDPEVDFKHSFAPLKTSSHIKSLPENKILAKVQPKNLEEDLGFMAGDIGSEDVMESDNLEVDDQAVEPQELMDENIDQTKVGLRRLHGGGSDYPVFNYGKSMPVKGKADVYDNSSDKASFLNHFPSFSLAGITLPKTPFNPLFIIVIIVAALAAGFILFTKAAVIVYVEPKVLENTAQVIADPTVTTVDTDKGIIPAQILKTTVSTTGTIDATGQKEIGDPAKGSVILYNKTDSDRTFSEGTELVSDGGLKFTLDSSVDVASESTQTEEGGTTTTFGKSSGSVTAEAIGPDSNLSAGSILTFSGLSSDSYSGSVDQSLSGGTSQTVTTVTAADQTKLKSQVLDTLKGQAQQDLQSKVTGDEKIVTDALVVDTSKYTYSKAVGDQATSFSLDATVSFKGTAYKDSDLKTIVAKLIETKVPDGFVFSLPDTQTSAAVSDIKDDGRLFFNASFTTKLIPTISSAQIINAIKGKRVPVAVNNLTNIDHILGAEIKLTPNYPAPLNFLPFLAKNISVTITPK